MTTFQDLFPQITQLKSMSFSNENIHKKVEELRKSGEELLDKTSNEAAQRKQELTAELAQMETDYNEIKALEIQETARHAQMLEDLKTWVAAFEGGIYVETKEEADAVQQFKKWTGIQPLLNVPEDEYNLLIENLNGLEVRQVTRVTREVIDQAIHVHNELCKPEKSSWRERD